MYRRHRLLAAVLAVVALLFAQFAVSAHACRAPGEATPVTASATHDCCNEGDAGAPDANLCLAHCQYGKVSFDGGHAVMTAPPPEGPALRVDLAAADRAEAGSRAAGLLPPASEPPVAVRFGVRRI